MKKESMRKFSVLGLVLIGASAVTAAVLPKNEPKKAQLAKLQASAGPNQLTCTLTEASVADNCTYTATNGIDSRTSEVGQATSTISTDVRHGLKTISSIGGTAVNGKNSSRSPV